jgi:hypothetical protein
VAEHIETSSEAGDHLVLLEAWHFVLDTSASLDDLAVAELVQLADRSLRTAVKVLHAELTTTRPADSLALHVER